MNSSLFFWRAFYAQPTLHYRIRLFGVNSPRARDTRPLDHPSLFWGGWLARLARQCGICDRIRSWDQNLSRKPVSIWSVSIGSPRLERKR